jgi:hypothetical protein
VVSEAEPGAYPIRYLQKDAYPEYIKIDFYTIKYGIRYLIVWLFDSTTQFKFYKDKIKDYVI